MMLKNTKKEKDSIKNRIMEWLEMKKMSIEKLVDTIHTLRKEKGLTQAQLADVQESIGQ